MIELHSSPTPNGQKVMIMLEETGLEWKHYDVNIRLGTYHLRMLIDMFRGNTYFAVASYNAGPTRVRQLRREA